MTAAMSQTIASPRVSSPLRLEYIPFPHETYLERGRSPTPTALPRYMPSQTMATKPAKERDLFIPAFDANMGTLQFAPLPFEAPVVVFVASGRGAVTRRTGYYVGAALRLVTGIVEALTARMRRLVGA